MDDTLGCGPGKLRSSRRVRTNADLAQWQSAVLTRQMSEVQILQPAPDILP